MAHVLLRELQRLAFRHADLRLHDVDTGDELGDGMLDLHARIHLHEEKVAARGIDDELYRTGVTVADMAAYSHRGIAHARTQRVVERG